MIKFKNIRNISLATMFFFIAIFVISLDIASATTRTTPGGTVCTLLQDSSTVCSSESYCSATTEVPPACFGHSWCLWGTRDCSPVTCTSFTYSAWSVCIGGTQTRTVTSSSPSGCTGGSPILSQSCCVSHDNSQCWNNDVYWYNSCNVREERIQDCLSSYCNTTGSPALYCNGVNVWGIYDYRIRGCSSGSCYYSLNDDSCGAKIIETCSGSTDCGYGICAENEKPIWGCANGACYYSCNYDSSCEGQAPNAIIDLPTGDQTIDVDDTINFSGHGTTDGTITAYEWRSGSCDEAGTLLKKEELGDVDFDPLQSSFNQTFTTPDTLNVYFRVRDNTGMWSTCQTRVITVNGAYSCTGLTPDGIYRIGCPESETGLTGDLSWIEAGTSLADCDGTKCQYYSPLVPPICLTPPACGSGDCGKIMESSCNDGSGSVAEEKCDSINGTDVDACNRSDIRCLCPPTLPASTWKEVAP
ncbi:MAG: hypothetical protein WA055_03720 [Candidatus Moraniibacteriota bacterium]